MFVQTVEVMFVIACREFKKAEQALKKAKQEAQTHGGAWRAREQELHTLRLQAAELQAAVRAGRGQLDEAAATAIALQADLAEAAHQHAAAEVTVPHTCSAVCPPIQPVLLGSVHPRTGAY